MAESLTLAERVGEGFVLSTEALNPKLGGGRESLWWCGHDPDHPGAVMWSGDPTEAAVFPTRVEAVQSFAELGSSRYTLPAVQLDLPAAAPPSGGTGQPGQDSQPQC